MVFTVLGFVKTEYRADDLITEQPLQTARLNDSAHVRNHCVKFREDKGV